MSKELPRRLTDHRRKVTEPQTHGLLSTVHASETTRTPRLSEGGRAPPSGSSSNSLDGKLSSRFSFPIKRSESHRVLAESGRSVYAVRQAMQRSLPNLVSTRLQGRSLFVQPPPSAHSAAVITKVASRTHTGSINGVEKQHNQDCSFTLEANGWHLLGVCDGHGVNGHLVSTFLKAFFPKFVYEALGSPEAQHIPDLASLALKYAYSKCSRGLQESNIDCTNSGSTCVTLIVHDTTLTCGNVGDSRAVLGRKCNGSWSATALSNDHKPDMREEYCRIVKAGGEVSVSKIAHAGPARVYLKGAQFPGLAMSRSMGDEFAKSVGVTSEPDILTVRLSKDDKFVVIASDGIWEFISNQDAVRIVSPCFDDGDATKASAALVQEAQNRWRMVDNMVDDITAVVAFLNA